MSVRSCIERPIGGAGGLRIWQVLECAFGVYAAGSHGVERLRGPRRAVLGSVKAAGVDPLSRPGRARRALSRPVVDEDGSGGGQIPG